MTSNRHAQSPGAIYDLRCGALPALNGKAPKEIEATTFHWARTGHGLRDDESFDLLRQMPFVQSFL